MCEAKHICINFLSQEQSALCAKFASGDIRARFAGVDHELTDRGVPKIADCCAWIEASIEREIEAGGHTETLSRIGWC